MYVNAWEPPGYEPGCSVYLDGEKVKYAIEADSDEGWVEFIVADENGVILVDDNDPTIARQERRYGQVVIAVPEYGN